MLTLDLPEHGQVALPLAGVGRRLLAALVDAALMLVTAVVLVMLTVLAATRWPPLAGPATFAIIALLPVVGPLAFELGWRGQTPGKRLMQLRVCSRDGRAVTTGQLFLRNVLRFIDFLPFGYLLGLATHMVSRHGQRLGDLAADTVVVREDSLALAGLESSSDVAAEPRRSDFVPGELARAARALLDRGRSLDPWALVRREAELIEALRRLRPELAHESDARLWARLCRPGDAP